jgi:hypothetical protein
MDRRVKGEEASSAHEQEPDRQALMKALTDLLPWFGARVTSKNSWSQLHQDDHYQQGRTQIPVVLLLLV